MLRHANRRRRLFSDIRSVCMGFLKQIFLGNDMIYESFFFFFIDTAPTEIYTLSLHDALPIGRAGKGTMTQLRPDDLAATIIRAALDKVPQLDPATIDDLMVGCGLPGGEQGFNLARVVAILLGHDHLPGTTVTRYCASSLQTTRMAFHAIKAGEGEVFLSAGVECVSRYAKGNSDAWPDTMNPVFDEARRRTETAAQGGV